MARIDFGLFARNRITEKTEEVYYKRHMWDRIHGRAAQRFAKRVSRDNETPLITVYNNMEVLVMNEGLFAKGEEAGSYTVTPEQIRNRPPTTRSYIKGRYMYEPVKVVIRLKE